MSRDAILLRIGLALGRIGARDDDRVQRIRAELGAPGARRVPASLIAKENEIETRFRDRLSALSVTILDAPDAAALPSLVKRYLEESQEPLRLRAAPLAFDFASRARFEAEGFQFDTDFGSERAGVTMSVALCGIAETGSLVLASGGRSPSGLGFLAQTHIVLLERQAIVATLEDAFQSVRRGFGQGLLPRCVNLVSGPSRTGDIGGRIIHGAHGPLRLAAVLLGPGR